MFDPSTIQQPQSGTLTAELVAYPYDRLHGVGLGISIVGAYEHRYNTRPPAIGISRSIFDNKVEYALWAGIGDRLLRTPVEHADLEGVHQFCESLTQHGYAEVEGIPFGNVKAWRSITLR